MTKFLCKISRTNKGVGNPNPHLDQVAIRFWGHYSGGWSCLTPEAVDSKNRARTSIIQTLGILVLLYTKIMQDP